MAQRRSNKYLGVAINEQTILVAEVANAGGRREVRRYAEFSFPEGTSAAQLAGAGKAFGAFLKQHAFGAREAIIGLPARWVVIKPKDLPPADPETAATLLRVQAEGEFSADLKEMVYDYAGDSHPKQPRQVLLMAVPRERLTQIHEFAEAARINVDGITPSVAALGVASKALAAPEGIVVYLGGKSAELAVQMEHGLQRIRHFATSGIAAPAMAGGGTAVAMGGSGSPELVAELRRTFAGIPQNGTPPADRKLVLWDGTGLDEAARSAISVRLGMPVEAQNLTAMGVGGQQLTAEASRFAPAVALATCPYLEGGLPVNFNDTRLKAPVESTTRQKMTWAVGILVVLALAVGALVWETQSEAATLAAEQANLDKHKSELAAAEALIKNVETAQSWYGGRHDPYLNCFVDVTKAFPPSQCYATKLDLAPLVNPIKPERPTPGMAVATTRPATGTLKGTITGKADNQRIPQEIVNKMLTSGRFPLAKVVSISENRTTVAGTPTSGTPNGGRGGRGGRGGEQPTPGASRSTVTDYTFVIDFNYSPPTAAAATGAAAAPVTGGRAGNRGTSPGRTGRPETPGTPVTPVPVTPVIPTVPAARATDTTRPAVPAAGAPSNTPATAPAR